VKIPKEIIPCFEHEPKVFYDRFLNSTEGEQKAYLDWIYEAKTEETKARRILEMMTRLHKGWSFYDKKNI